MKNSKWKFRHELKYIISYAEKDIIDELKEIGKPFIVIVNSTHPTNPDTEKLAKD